MQRVLTIDARELYFSAAHYLPRHPQCGVLHGHTYYVRNLKVTVKGFVDLGDIKSAIKTMDHCTLIPECDLEAWKTLGDVIETNPDLEIFGKIFSKVYPIVDTDIPGTTVERIAEALKDLLKSIPGIVDVHFVLTEGPIAGREI